MREHKQSLNPTLKAQTHTWQIIMRLSSPASSLEQQQRLEQQKEQAQHNYVNNMIYMIV